MMFIWLHQYLTLSSLGQIFGVSVSPVCENLSTTCILPIMYEHYIQLYMRWYDEYAWNPQQKLGSSTSKRFGHD